ncbi:MAG: TonB family protein [Thermoanaerobaculia bacterium]|nr:TonB family protein [Thermoanaerobaculia bacterium]
MSAREEFGKYTLLKKLAEDPLGETFRAGRLGAQGLEQVVLLRVFNGSGLDSERLWSAILGRQGLHQALKSPNIGHGVDAGRVHGLPYLAYDYISGKNLANLAAQATQQGSPFPLDHALLVAERIALALTAAYETRQGDERTLHGLPLPHLVMLSNEGETRLLGFEAGPGLAALAPSLVPELRRYASPELRAGQPLSKADDVFTIGAILFELLTGTRIPESAPAGHAALVDGAQMAEGGAFPPAVAALLKRSLAPREDRYPDSGLWHKAISRLISEGHYGATTFNLAFFVHNLFREDIERESKEIEQEQTLEMPRRAAPAEPAAPARAETRPAAGRTTAPPAAETPARGQYAAAQEEKASGGGKGLYIGLAAALLVGAGVAGWLFLGKNKAGGPPVDPNAAAQPAVVDPATQPPVDAGPTKEELQAQIDRLLEERTQAKLGELKTEYDKQIAAMREQLKQAQERPAAPRPEPVAVAPPKPVEAPPVKEEPTKQPDPEPAPPVPTPEPEPTPAPVTPPPAPVPEPAPVKTVKLGDLVSLGTPGSKPPTVLKRAQPQYPRMAERFGKEAIVDVRVLVDENGRVINTELAAAKAGYGFDEEALRAARMTTYQPATKDGIRVRMWTTLRVAFKPKGA